MFSWKMIGDRVRADIIEDAKRQNRQLPPISQLWGNGWVKHSD